MGLLKDLFCYANLIESLVLLRRNILRRNNFSEATPQFPLLLRRRIRPKARILRSEPLCRHTTFKIGGPVDMWAEAEDIDDIKGILEISRAQGLPLFLIGSGSNLLVSDEGLRGVAVCLRRGWTRIERTRMDADRILCQAGCELQRFILYTIENGYFGLEFMAGIPGTVGGAVRTNAGAGLNGPWLSDFINRVKMCDYSGNVSWIEKGNIRFDYRDSGLEDVIILEAEFNLRKPRNRESPRREYRKFLAKKREGQEISMPSAGCVFKNPVGARRAVPLPSAAQLIEGCGLKGKRIGDAMVSEKHANFIVNVGGATFNDVIELIELIKNSVIKKYNIKLETEIEILK